MKNFKTIMAVAFTALLFSCSTTKETTSTKAAPNRGSSNQNTSVSTSPKTVSSSRTTDKNVSSMAASERNAEGNSKMELKKMYTDLDMTSDQITRFESEWKKTSDSWKRNNPKKAMNTYERVEYQDRILSNILSDAQFESYQEWVRNNAGRK